MVTEGTHPMMHPEQFDTLVDELMRLNNLDEETASAAASQAADCHEVDADGRIIVTVRGKRLRLIWP